MTRELAQMMVVLPTRKQYGAAVAGVLPRLFRCWERVRNTRRRKLVPEALLIPIPFASSLILLAKMEGFESQNTGWKHRDPPL